VPTISGSARRIAGAANMSLLRARIMIFSLEASMAARLVELIECLLAHKTVTRFAAE
jgi:hypothetical protein